jgi:hypothetical protein
MNLASPRSEKTATPLERNRPQDAASRRLASAPTVPLALRRSKLQRPASSRDAQAVSRPRGVHSRASLHAPPTICSVQYGDAFFLHPCTCNEICGVATHGLLYESPACCADTTTPMEPKDYMMTAIDFPAAEPSSDVAPGCPPSVMEAYPVEPLVSSVRNDGPELIRRSRIAA